MRCDCICSHIVCRVLYRSKRVNLLSYRKHNDTARMLSSGTSYPNAAFYDTVYLAGTLVFSTFFIIIFYITKCCLISQCTNCTGAEGLTISKNNFCILMRLTLVLTGEVKVNIRLLVSFESKKCFKRNIESVFYQLLTTHRAVLIRHVTSCHSCKGFYFIRIEIRIMALLTVIMGAKWINLRDSRHCSYEGRSYRTS